MMTWTTPRRPLAPAALTALSVLVMALLFGGLRTDSAPLPDFTRFETAEARKSAFFDYLRPIVRKENARIRTTRERLLRIAEALARGETPGWWDRRFISNLAERYGVEASDLEAKVSALELRVDVVPESLALIQAAKESGWGTSRFAQQGNNLFGQWCFDPGCGIVPEARSASARHEVRAFDSVRASVASYLRNLNTHQRYKDLRALRASLRAADEPLSGMALAEALTAYSERGRAYVREVQSMIISNGLRRSP